MAVDKKISQLASGAPAQAGDEYVVARSGANYKLTLTNIAASMPPIGATTPNTGSFTSLTNSGNLTFSATAQRITGDFSNATLSSRLLFQTSTTNGNTGVGIIPNGTGTVANIRVYNANDPNNASIGDINAVGSTDIRLASGITGTGTYLPMTFYTGGSERMRLDTSGNLGIGTASPDARLTVSGGAASFADGTSSAPAIANAGDLDTGVYFPAANEVAVTTGGTVAAGFNSNGLFFRNRIINGDMRIDQRNAGASVAVPAGQSPYTVDRFALSNNTDGAASAQQDSSAPSGFVNSIKITTTTADATLTTNQNLHFYQNIEGTNIADLAWGTASARPVTLSFWVRSSLTGTFGGALRNSGAARSYPFSYSISVADTWEYKTITVPGDTTGTWLTTTGIGINVVFGLGAGPDRSGTAGAWASASIIAPTGAVSVIGTLNATWYVTGVQLETGSVATPFERRPYGTELMLCQRYFLASNTASPKGAAVGSVGAIGVSTSGLGAVGIRFPVSMRASPSVAIYNNGVLNQVRVSSTGATATITTPAFSTISPLGAAYFVDSGGTPFTSSVPYDFDFQASIEL